MVSARFFCGFDSFQHDAPLDASTMTRWLGPAGLKEMLKASVGIALDSGVAKPGSLERVSVDTTVQPKAIAGTRDIGRATLFLRRYAAPLTATCSFMRLPSLYWDRPRFRIHGCPFRRTPYCRSA